MRSVLATLALLAAITLCAAPAQGLTCRTWCNDSGICWTTCW